MDTETQAKITVQSLVSRFPHVSGMTGTAWTSRKEFKKIYQMPVSVIPTNRRPQRIELPIKYTPTEAEKWEQIVQDVIEIHSQGRPILVGTRSIAKSEILACLLYTSPSPRDRQKSRMPSSA